jgi:DNA modification methylase
MRLAAPTLNLGTGTLALAARRHDRRWLLIESVPRYVEMARRRLAADE